VSVEPLSPQHAELVDAIAWRVVELLTDRGTPVRSRRQMLSAAELATELGVARSFVYDHADELGAVRLGGGSKPRLRFAWRVVDLERARTAFACCGSNGSQGSIASDDGQSPPVARRPSRRLPVGLPKPGSVLAIRGPSTPAEAGHARSVQS
jgi:hypothetical protein